MKSTTKLTICSFSLAALLFAVSPAPAAPSSATWLAVGSASTGQFGIKSNASQQKSEVAGLLKQARAAIKSKDFATADRKIAQAEAFRLKYGTFHFGDTPAKARRDLRKIEQDRRSDKPGTAQRIMAALL